MSNHAKIKTMIILITDSHFPAIKPNPVETEYIATETRYCESWGGLSFYIKSNNPSELGNYQNYFFSV